ncbi:hypothetical protein [Sphingomonas sp.]|uniref:hypothetical protein n=1 Tax=Sphingomonas sp. TaxID=28214 RepID=UPI001B199BC0|nr:hypothetical protein [Sphingomonas sp.]MBO9712859.1 hypothetical protein [Sphingomonas sp.]
MELLLLLTALLASLTGAAGDRASARQVQGVAVVQAIEAAQAAVQPSRSMPLAAALPTMRVARAATPRPEALPVGQGRAAPERRLE